MAATSSPSIHDAVPTLAGDTSALAQNMLQAGPPVPLLILRKGEVVGGAPGDSGERTPVPGLARYGGQRTGAIAGW